MITRQQFTLESSGEKMKKIQNIEFFMRILNLFLDFQSDVRFRRNDGFKIARHFESLALLCVCGFLSLVLYCIAMYAGGHLVCVK